MSLYKFNQTRSKKRVIENQVMENRVKRGITVQKKNLGKSKPYIPICSFLFGLCHDNFTSLDSLSLFFGFIVFY